MCQLLCNLPTKDAPLYTKRHTFGEKKKKGVGWGCTESYKGIKVGLLHEVSDSTTLNKSLSHMEYNLVWLCVFVFFFFKSSEID